MSYKIKNASCLIRTRECHIGFPNAFSHYPEGMPEETRAKLLSMVQEAMGNDLRAVSMDPDGVRRRIVITEGNYQVLGICAILSDFMEDPEGRYNAFRDEAGRACYGFFGFVWDMSRTALTPTSSFPALEAFREMVGAEIAAHWYSPEPLDENGHYTDAAWKTKVTLEGGIPVGYGYEVSMGANRIGLADVLDLNTQNNLIQFFSSQQNEQVLLSAVKESWRSKGRHFSLCTNLGLEDGEASLFMNATTKDADSATMGNRLARAPKGAVSRDDAPNDDTARRPGAAVSRDNAPNDSPAISLNAPVDTKIHREAPEARLQQYQLEMGVVLPRNPEYDANSVCHHFENQCLCLWQNSQGRPRASMKSSMNPMDRVWQGLKGQVMCQRKKEYTITAENYSETELWSSLCEASRKTSSYFRTQQNLRVKIQMELLVPIKQDSDAVDAPFVPAEAAPSKGPVNVNTLFDEQSVRPVNVSDLFDGQNARPASRGKEKKGGDPFQINFD